MKNILKNLKKNIAYTLEDFDLLSVAKILIFIGAIGHLILSKTQIKALLKLEDIMCGFYFFMFILFGLIILFESTRLRKGKVTDYILTYFFTLVTLGFGVTLINIYRNAIKVQKEIDLSIVNKGYFMSYAVCGIFIVSAILVLVHQIKSKKNK